MGTAIPYAYRKLIIKRRQSGWRFKDISEALGYSVSGIKKIWYNYQKQGEASLIDNYSNCGRATKYDKTVRDKINQIRTGKQGASYVYSKLIQENHSIIPSIRTLQRWWQQEGVGRQRGRPSSGEKKDGRLRLITLGR